MHQVFYITQRGGEAPKLMISFEIGEKVRAYSGPFVDFDGMVEGVDDQRQEAKFIRWILRGRIALASAASWLAERLH
ncbi:hypothetical protein [Ruegeria faecimaris]|uniref:Uncharacterized protein n=1 Tax=Ruegeria faecimaris TaxID=686389 RepID=A0A521D6F8_9RHOB|nr:hypothetical protein [Ruegeria faecimaris]SMO67293.1 hypothetical protein SAMN06265380_10515 [Ruegeria faecimaris]